ncbi:hypothetical protein ACYJ1Y_16375 [Natrialbaceae archaeon A-gly3]
MSGWGARRRFLAASALFTSSVAGCLEDAPGADDPLLGEPEPFADVGLTAEDGHVDPPLVHLVDGGTVEWVVEGVLSFRDDVADAAGVPASPASPTRVLELLVVAINDRAETLADAVSDHDDDLRRRVIPYANRVQESTDRVDETLEHTKFGTFRAVSAAIGYDNAWQLYAARHLRSRHGEELSREADETLEDLIETLELLNVAREHFKTTYLQRELTRFSQLTIYCGVPSILSAMTLGFLYADFAGAAIELDFLPFVVSGLVVIVVSPLALLVSYILRTATVTRRTASIGPMLPQKDPDSGPFEVAYGEEFGAD